MPYQYDPEKSKKRQQEQYSQMKKTLEGVLESYQEDPRLMLEYLKFKSNFPSYSTRNTALIRTQNPHAVVTGSFKHWKDMGYRVKKGEHGLKIMVPVKTDLFRSERADGTRQTKSVKAATAKEQEEIRQGRIHVFERITYRVGYVFDISQTDCPPEAYPKLFSAGYPSETHAKLYEAVKAFAKGKGIPVEEANLKISDRLNDTQKLDTLLHEMGHAILSETDAKRPVNSMKEPAAFMEAEADAVSILLHEHLGVEVSDTVKRHFMKSCEKLKGAGELDIGKLLDEVGKVYDEFREELDPFLEQAVERETLGAEKTETKSKEKAPYDPVARWNYDVLSELISDQEGGEKNISRITPNGFDELFLSVLPDGEISVLHRWEENGTLSTDPVIHLKMDHEQRTLNAVGFQENLWSDLRLVEEDTELINTLSALTTQMLEPYRDVLLERKGSDLQQRIESAQEKAKTIKKRKNKFTAGNRKL